ncbi:UvrD-helicase domain-containing protein [Acidobacteriota bacterium]
MKPIDYAERERIVTELDRTFLVEAGAGSGKTKSLVDRMIAYLRSGTCKTDTLAAVTFTRKAAAELRERFQTNLERAYSEAKEEEVKRLLGESLRNLEQCFIGTIHSFCARMLRERPIEIALLPDFKEMDDIEDAVYREQCWLDYLIEVRRESPPELEALNNVGLEPEDLKDAFTTISLYPEVKLIGGEEKPPDFEAIRNQVGKFLDRMRNVVPYKKQDEDRDDFQTRMIRLFIRKKNIGFENHLVLMETLEDMEKGFRITQKHWPDKEEAKDAKTEFDVFREAVVRIALERWREYRHSRIINFLKPSIHFYYEQRKKHSLVNFADLLLSVSSLLRNNPQVRAYFQRTFTHILVDEFQDTDPVQAEILMYLTGTDIEEQNWRKLTPKPGTLFLVGDPKQSIYRFRRADIDTYNVAREQILRSGGDVLKLTANFRSLNCLAEWINPIFKRTFPEEADRFQAPFAPMNTIRKDDATARSGLYKITIEKKPRHKQRLIAEEDAAAIADWINWACNGYVIFSRTEDEINQGLGGAAVPSDFLLLFRYKKLMSIYARALEEHGIPYEITGTDAFTDSGDICEIVNLARSLRCPDNPVFLVAVLRGIFFGVSDNALLEFKRAGGRFSYLLEKDLDGNQGAEYVTQCLKVLKKWWRWTKDFPASTAIEMIFEDSGVINYLASSEMGSSKAGNVLKLLEFVRKHERDGQTAFSDIVAYMEELADVREVEEMSLTPGRADAVRLMNLHKAKGLEATVVFLANPKGTRAYEPDKHVVRLEKGGPRGYFVFKKKEWYTEKILSQPLDWEKSVEEEKRYEEAEEERLLYVAATRAKNLLVVSTYDGNLTNKSWGLLDESLTDVPELEIPEPGFVAGKKQVSVSLKQYEEIKASLRGNIEQGFEPSYLVESVTSIAKGEGELPGWSEIGKGMSWGRAVHHMLEVLGKWDGKIDEETLDTLAGNSLVAEEIDLYEKRKLLDLVNTIMKSEFWGRVQKAEKKYFEVPFSVMTDSEVLKIEGDGKKDVILSGTIDLAFREDDGWVIADYKTDSISEGQSLKRFIDYYTPQVRIYTRFWEEITGQKVKESGLYFTFGDQWVKIYPN